MQFQRKLFNARKSKGLSQKELGAMAGVSSATISRIEKGLQIPSFELALSIIEATGLSWTEFFWGLTSLDIAAEDVRRDLSEDKFSELDAIYATLPPNDQKVFRDIVDIMKMRLEM